MEVMHEEGRDEVSEMRVECVSGRMEVREGGGKKEEGGKR